MSVEFRESETLVLVVPSAWAPELGSGHAELPASRVDGAARLIRISGRRGGAADGLSGERQLAAVEIEVLGREVVDVRKGHRVAKERVPAGREVHRPSQVVLGLGVPAPL